MLCKMFSRFLTLKARVFMWNSSAELTLSVCTRNMNSANLTKTSTTGKTKRQHSYRTALLSYLHHREPIQCLSERRTRKGFHWTPQIFQRCVALIGLVSHNLFPSSESTVEPLLRSWALTAKREGLWLTCLSCTGNLTLLPDLRNKHLRALLLLETARIQQE